MICGGGADAEQSFSESERMRSQTNETPSISTVHMVEWEVTRQLSVRVTPFLYLIFLLMYLHKIVCQKFWTPCDVHFENGKADKGSQLSSWTTAGLGLVF